MELNLRKNLGEVDRIIRVLIAIALLGLLSAKLVTGWWSAIVFFIATSQFVEALLGY